MQKLLMISLALILLSPCAWAEEIYVDVDEDGTPTFSDQDKPGSKKVEINTPVTYETKVPVPVQPRGRDKEERPEKVEYTAKITDPEDDAAVRENSGAMTLTVSIEPGLVPGHSAELMMDGQKIRGLTGSGPVELTNVDRGTHGFRVQIVDKDGKVVHSGPETRVSMLRYHLPIKKPTPSPSN